MPFESNAKSGRHKHSESPSGQSSFGSPRGITGVMRNLFGAISIPFMSSNNEDAKRKEAGNSADKTPSRSSTPKVNKLGKSSRKSARLRGKKDLSTRSNEGTENGHSSKVDHSSDLDSDIEVTGEFYPSPNESTRPSRGMSKVSREDQSSPNSLNTKSTKLPRNVLPEETSEQKGPAKRKRFKSFERNTKHVIINPSSESELEPTAEFSFTSTPPKQQKAPGLDKSPESSSPQPATKEVKTNSGTHNANVPKSGHVRKSGYFPSSTVELVEAGSSLYRSLEAELTRELEEAERSELESSRAEYSGMVEKGSVPVEAGDLEKLSNHEKGEHINPIDQTDISRMDKPQNIAILSDGGNHDSNLDSWSSVPELFRIQTVESYPKRNGVDGEEPSPVDTVNPLMPQNTHHTVGLRVEKITSTPLKAYPRVQIPELSPLYDEPSSDEAPKKTSRKCKEAAQRKMARKKRKSGVLSDVSTSTNAGDDKRTLENEEITPREKSSLAGPGNVASSPIATQKSGSAYSSNEEGQGTGSLLFEKMSDVPTSTQNKYEEESESPTYFEAEQWQDNLDQSASSQLFQRRQASVKPTLERVERDPIIEKAVGAGHSGHSLSGIFPPINPLPHTGENTEVVYISSAPSSRASSISVHPKEESTTRRSQNPLQNPNQSQLHSDTTEFGTVIPNSSQSIKDSQRQNPLTSQIAVNSSQDSHGNSSITSIQVEQTRSQLQPRRAKRYRKSSTEQRSVENSRSQTGQETGLSLAEQMRQRFEAAGNSFTGFGTTSDADQGY